MESARAIELVHNLADRVDPFTGERFPSDSPCQQADTARAQHLVLEGLVKLKRSTARKSIDTIHGRIVNVDIDVDANHDGAINGADEPLEVDPGGLACVCTNKLTPIKLKLQPAGLPGKVTFSATMSGRRIKVWRNANRAGQIDLSKRGNVVPGTLYVEGVVPSAALRDVELHLGYNENAEGQDNPLFKCEDRVRLTIVKVEIEKCDSGFLPQGGRDDNTTTIRAFVTPNTAKGKFKFTLFDVSDEPGYCMNAPINVSPTGEDSDVWKDFQFPAQNGFTILGSDNNIARTETNILHEATASD
jgi:hypothetical protein